MLTKWTHTLLNISKLDTTIANFQKAMDEQVLALKATKANINGTKADILKMEEQHDHLSGIEQRTERFCKEKRSQIKNTDGLIQEASRE